MTEESKIKHEIPLPDAVTASFEDNTLHIKGKKGELNRVFSHPDFTISVANDKISIQTKKFRRKQKSLMGTYVAHINNMIHGVTNGFEYQMKTVYSHFPIKTNVEDNMFVIQNFLGERSPRKALILDGVTVKAKGDDVTVEGIDKEKVGQTVANIERATAVSRRDIRVFQDGIYLTSKGDD
jgi:large subunit ribosomal protein L6